MVLGALAVGLGALGAHALKELLTSNQLASYLTGIRYHILHVIVILVIMALRSHFKPKAFEWAIRLFFAGILLFSGSIYVLATKDLSGWEWAHILGPVTPLGGLLLISGWITSAMGLNIKSQL